MNAESAPRPPMQHPDPSQAELWDSAAAAVARARANLREQPEIIDGASKNMEAERIVDDEYARAAAEALPDAPGKHSAFSTGEVRGARNQVADSHFDAGRIPGHASASQPPAWATEPTGERPITSVDRSTEDPSNSEPVDPYPKDWLPRDSYLDPEDIATDRGRKPEYMPRHGPDVGPSTNPWASGRANFPTIQPPQQGGRQ